MFTRIQERDVEAFNAAARTQKCLQMANGAVYVNSNADGETDARSKEWKEVHDEKLTALESLVEESGGVPILVSAKFQE